MNIILFKTYGINADLNNFISISKYQILVQGNFIFLAAGSSAGTFLVCLAMKPEMVFTLFVQILYKVLASSQTYKTKFKLNNELTSWEAKI